MVLIKVIVLITNNYNIMWYMADCSALLASPMATCGMSSISCGNPKEEAIIQYT